MRGFFNLMQLSVIFALTLLIKVQSKSISNVTTTTTTTTERSNDSYGEIKVLNGSSSTENEQTEKYEIIEVTHGNKSGNQTAGRTTRIYTIGSVNDDFWIKHLGNDFKNAIHLQVGGNDHYNEMFNSSNPDGHREEVLHEYLPGSDFPSSSYNPSQNFNDNTLPKSDNESLPHSANIITLPTETAQNSTNTGDWQKTQSHDSVDNPQSFESIFTIDGNAIKFAHKYLQENSKNSLPVAYDTPNKMSNAQKTIAKNSQASHSSQVQSSSRVESTKPSKRKPSSASTQSTDAKSTTKNVHMPSSSSSSYQTPNGYEEPSLSNLYSASEPVEMDTAMNKPDDSSSQALLSYILRKSRPSYEARLASGLLPFQKSFKDFNIRQHRDTKQNILERGI